MDTRFSSAIHTLILISEADTPMTSDEIAESVGTNASYIRKLTALLKKAGIINSHRGVTGFLLAIEPKKLTMFTIYKAIYGADRVALFDLHQNPSDQCVVGRHIQPVLTETFEKIEAEAQRALTEETLADCIERMKNHIRSEAK